MKPSQKRNLLREAGWTEGSDHGIAIWYPPPAYATFQGFPLRTAWQMFMKEKQVAHRR
jgi:hypothetical protein